MKINSRINRIIGQLRGINRMCENKRDCIEILQQISAVKKAVDGLSKEIVALDLCRYTSASKRNKVIKLMERLIKL